MLLCPRCGIENDPGSTACWACSLELGPPEQSAARSREPGGFKTIPGAGGATPRNAEPGGFKTIPGAGGAAPRSAEPGGF
ncbi:MAG TPA: hypothetical protein VGJ84_08305, partial [Polyangiaceae bacterium]